METFQEWLEYVCVCVCAWISNNSRSVQCVRGCNVTDAVFTYAVNCQCT